MNIDFILWNPDLVIFNIGPFAIRWYSTCWLIGLLGSYLMVKYLYRKQGLSDEKFEPLFLYCFVGILIGARWATVSSMSPAISSPHGNTWWR